MGTDTIFLLDVDNTLLDNDRIEIDVKAYLDDEFGREARDSYWSIFEALRTELGYVDYLGALQRFRLENLSDPKVLRMSSFLLDYPFAERLYPGALETIGHLQSLGEVAILSDGDAVFQPRKIRRSGLWDAVEGRVLIYIHKEETLDAMMIRYPGQRYVMVDDKLRILAAMKEKMGDRLVSVFVRQGHYALDARTIAAYRPADIEFERIGELVHFKLPPMIASRSTASVPAGA
jgi:FMN phosphatase YigB (HAD superfamily)